MTAFRKDIADNVILENWSDLASHPYCLTVDVTQKPENQFEELELSIYMIIPLVKVIRHTTVIQRPLKTLDRIIFYEIVYYY